MNGAVMEMTGASVISGLKIHASRRQAINR